MNNLQKEIIVRMVKILQSASKEKERGLEKHDYKS